MDKDVNTILNNIIVTESWIRC